MLHKFSTWILFASAPVNSYSMPFSSFSFSSFFFLFLYAISCAISRQEKGWLHKCIAQFITYSSPGRADTWFPSLPRKECTGVRYVITKFSRMDGLPNFLTHGAPLARFAFRSSAISKAWYFLLVHFYGEADACYLTLRIRSAKKGATFETVLDGK